MFSAFGKTFSVECKINQVMGVFAIEEEVMVVVALGANKSKCWT